MKVLVTGATGLIGCHSVKALVDERLQVRVYVRDRRKLGPAFEPLGLRPEQVEIAEGDLSSSEALESALKDCEGVLHCAGRFSPNRADEEMLVETNVAGTRLVLAAAAAANLKRIVYVSSILALFPPRKNQMTALDDVTQPSSMYAATKADAERVARSFQEESPLTIVYPAAVQGPEDPTFSIGPKLVADALVAGEVLVTEGGLPSTDVRDLARVVARMFSLSESDSATVPARLMAPSFFLTHEAYHRLLEEITGRELKARRIPAGVLRGIGRVGDWVQKLGKNVQLTYEAAEVLTRSVPVDDREARALLQQAPIDAESSFRDLVEWMVRVGHLPADAAGKASSYSPGDVSE